jgi:hypothetical protein
VAFFWRVIGHAPLKRGLSEAANRPTDWVWAQQGHCRSR